jgi:hypothetical protein
MPGGLPAQPSFHSLKVRVRNLRELRIFRINTEGPGGVLPARCGFASVQRDTEGVQNCISQFCTRRHKFELIFEDFEQSAAGLA